MDWLTLFLGLRKTDYFPSLVKQVSQLYETELINPASQNLLKAFQLTPFSLVKVVILGQDPYPNKEDSMGLAFSSTNDSHLPKSLKNIFKELELEYGKKRASGDLSSWATQGVLLFNSQFITKAHEPLAFKSLPFRKVTEAIIEALNDDDSFKVFVFLGREAQKYAPLINTQKHTLLMSSHPSPLGAYRGFIGSHIFKQINEELMKNKIEPIDYFKD